MFVFSVFFYCILFFELYFTVTEQFRHYFFAVVIAIPFIFSIIYIFNFLGAVTAYTLDLTFPVRLNIFNTTYYQ